MVGAEMAKDVPAADKACCRNVMLSKSAAAAAAAAAARLPADHQTQLSPVLRSYHNDGQWANLRRQQQAQSSIY